MTIFVDYLVMISVARVVVVAADFTHATDHDVVAAIVVAATYADIVAFDVVASALDRH